MHHPINTRGFCVFATQFFKWFTENTQIISINRPLVLLMQRHFVYCQAGIAFFNIILIYFLSWKVKYTRHE